MTPSRPLSLSLARSRGRGPGRPRVRHLSTAERSSYDVLSPDLAVRARVVHLPWLPGRYAGITLGRFVLLDRDLPADGRSPLLAHELVHVRQWSELGLVGFLARYVGDFAIGVGRHRRWHRAYRDISLECEARDDAEHWLQRRNDRRAL